METKLLDYTIEQAEYPAYPQFVNPENYYKADGAWDHEAYHQAEKEARQAIAAMGKGKGGDHAALLTFADKTAGRVRLSRGGENGVFSPVSLYTAMAMLAELCTGRSREQVLAAMGAGELEAMRAAVHQLWIDSYCESGVVTSRMGSSVWLNEQVSYHAETLRTLAEHYFASSYRVAMGTDAAGRAIGAWINEQTGGLLSDEADNIRTEAMTLLQLYTTIYFKARWENIFPAERTEKDLFRLADGTTLECDFMHRSGKGACRRGEGYTAAMLPFAAGGGYMTLCLPDEDVLLSELLQRDTLVSELRQMDEYGNIIHWTVPKFDVSSSIGLNNTLQELGVQAAFDAQAADFTPLTDVPAFLSNVRPAARVKVDEEGVEAAAFTEMAVCTASLPMGEVEMRLDRPFLFAIYDAGGLPLFVGTVQNPE